MKRARLPDFTSGAGPLVAGGAVGQVAMFASIPIISRLFTPQEYGLFTLIAAMSAFLGILSALRLDSMVSVLPNDQEASALVRIVMLVALVVGALSGLLFFLLRAVPGDVAMLSLLLSLAILSTAAYEITAGWLARTQATGALARRPAVQGITQAGSQILAGLMGLGATGLVLGWILSRALASAEGAISSLLPSNGISLQALLTIAARIKGALAIGTLAVMFNVASQQFPPVALGLGYGVATLGAVGMAIRVVGAPSTLVGAAFSRSYQMTASILIRHDRDGLTRATLTTVGQLALLGAVPYLVLFFAAPPILGVVLGGGWEFAGQLAQILALPMFVQFCISPVLRGFFLLQSLGIAALVDAARLTACIGTIGFIWLAGGTPQSAVLGYGVALLSSYIASFLMLVKLTHARDGGLR